MSSKIVGIIGPGGEGGTFLDWSLHYLTGDPYVKYVLVDRLENEVLGIRKHYVLFNPITHEGTSHKHCKAHPTEPLIQSCIEMYQTVDDPNINIHTLYIVPSTESYANGRSYTTFVKQVADTYTEIKLIQFHYPNIFLEDLAVRIKTKMPNNNERIEDIRARVTIESNTDNKIIDNPNVYSLDIADMFYNLDTLIHEIFNWLSLTIKEEKYDNWLAVYKEWQLAQKFCTTTR